MQLVLKSEPWYIKDDTSETDIYQHGRYGDIGRVYGAQWRKYGFFGFDQVQYVIDNIKQNPTSRYNIINAWNGDEFLGIHSDVALPACHVYFSSV
jgi:thymidylate synthase